MFRAFAPELEQFFLLRLCQVQRAELFNAWSDPHFKKTAKRQSQNLIWCVTTDVVVYPAISACREGPSTGVGASGSHSNFRSMSRRAWNGGVVLPTNTLWPLLRLGVGQKVATAC